jgi:hypothetical protein
MLGSRALYHRGWKAVTYHPVGPVYNDGLDPNAPFDEDRWELYHVAEDLSETTDLADEHPDKVNEMVELWWGEAARNDVLPLDNRVLLTLTSKPTRRPARDVYRYFQGGSQVPETAAVNVRNRSHVMRVTVVVPEGTVANGVLLALGSGLGGWSLHVVDGSLRYVHNLYGKTRFELEAPGVVPSGRHDLEFVFDKSLGAGDDGLGGTARLVVNGAIVAEGHLERFTPSGFTGLGVGLTCGYEWGPAVGTGYRAPFAFNGVIRRAEIEATGPVVRDPLAELAAIMSEQ